MSKLKRVPTNKATDSLYLKRDELERELVRKDKQALIGDCLKIFDVNTMLFELGEAHRAEIDQLKIRKVHLEVEIERLKSRSLWTILNERIAYRLERRRKRRNSVNYSTI